ncbi:sulfite exporter TauE/SafE family protein [Neptuniibacter halophilus]|uniref:sulfite exporter TauE/SafE family protein n=1 Tax=Neptuniibacter halophilus TaxID=651666 RepID=UPI002573D10C|nr:sulfite exporter TauE/SafE family protein [Neptuniibacter halophilus]
MIEIEWALLSGALVGFIVGITGVGGGALMAPILLLGFKLDLTVVIATDLLFATITKLAASGLHAKNGYVDRQIIKRMWLGSIPAAVIVVALAHSGLLFDHPSWIATLLGFLVILSGLSMLFGKYFQALQKRRRIATPTSFKKLQPSATVLGGVLLGGLVSTTSIGAGAVGALLLRALYPLRMQPKNLVATDTLHAIPVSLIAGVSYLGMGYTHLELLSYLVLGSIPAAIIGSHMVTLSKPELIKNLLSIALLIAGYKLLST